MSARTTSEVARKATSAIGKSQKHPATALPAKRNRTPGQEYGRQIFVFNHLQKNMIVYSLTKALRNNAALAQIPFNGKKTVPAALRKDLWHPFAQITFPPGFGFVGLSAFQKLREYRRRHELEWGDEIFLNKEDKPEKRKVRGRKICDQKANSVADMAAVLGRLVGAERPTRVLENGRWVWPPRIGLKREGQGVQVEVLWRDLIDAEYAEAWSDNVSHGTLPLHTNHRDPNKTWGLKRLYGGRSSNEQDNQGSAVEDVGMESAPKLQTRPEKAVL